MGRASRDKGKRGELEVAAIFTRAGLPADRTAALQAGSVPHVGDVTVRDLPWLHVESKRCEIYSLPEWQRQAEAAAGPATPLIAYRKSGTSHSPEPWRAVVHLDWLAGLLAELHQLHSESATTH